MGSRVVAWRNGKFVPISIVAATAVVAGAVFLAGVQSASARSYWSFPFGNMHSINPGGSFFRWRPRRHYSTGKRHHRDAQRDRSPREQAQAAGPQGPFHVVISLNKQRLTLYDGNGAAVAHSPVSTGVPGHPTPTGVFSVLERRKWHRSNLYSDAPMPYMQRITWSGIALHEGELPGRPASHGCIRLPAKFARTLWHTTRVGARVIIVRDDVQPVAFSHPSLLALKPEPPPPPPSEVASPVEASAAELTMSPAAGNASAAAPVQTVAAADAGSAVDASPPRQARKRTKRAAPKLRPGPVSVFVSGKTGKVYVRKGFEPVMSAPVTIERPEEPLGTHVFTALGYEADGTTLRFTAATVSGESGDTAALDRVTLPPEVVERVSKLMTPGASLIISDKGLGHETGRGTDFIVLTH
jgi:lipoprotein-anchoring transpeptidase ErfK/SrfK